MTIRLTDKANEESTAILRVTFTDSDGNAVLPQSATWTLSDRDNEVVNGKSDVTISPLASTVDILLKGDDLKLPFPRERVLGLGANLLLMGFIAASPSQDTFDRIRVHEFQLVHDRNQERASHQDRGFWRGGLPDA